MLRSFVVGVGVGVVGGGAIVVVVNACENQLPV
jgi:hypothetical protein